MEDPLSNTLPADLQYTSHDEWIRTEGDDTIVIGITDFAQDALGEIVHVELPEVDAELDVGESAGEIESVKAVAEFYAPVAGTVIAVNEDLDDEPEALNEKPYDAWIFKMKVADVAALAGLLDASAYQAKIDEA